eukprot:1531861-Alexandrium_andersonii.AAC.1
MREYSPWLGPAYRLAKSRHASKRLRALEPCGGMPRQFRGIMLLLLLLLLSSLSGHAQFLPSEQAPQSEEEECGTARVLTTCVCWVCAHHHTTIQCAGRVM